MQVEMRSAPRAQRLQDLACSRDKKSGMTPEPFPVRLTIELVEQNILVRKHQRPFYVKRFTNE